MRRGAAMRLAKGVYLVRIGMFCDMYTPYVSGVTNHIRLTKAAMEAAGHEVWVFTFGARDHEDDEPNVVRSPGLPFGDTGWQMGVGFSAEAKRAIAALDVAHAHHPFVSGRLALRACGPAGIPVVQTNHTRYDLYADVYARFVPRAIRMGFLRASLRSIYGRSHAVVSPSAEIAEWIASMGVDTGVTVIHNGIDTARFREPRKPWSKADLGLADDAVALCYLGRLGAEKRVGALFEAWEQAAVEDRRLALVFVGDGPERDRLESAAAAWPGRVTLTGLVDYARVPGVLAACDAFATASVSEVHPLTVMEGMAAALPAVAVESPGIGETVDHEESGLLVADGDGLGGAILRIADDTLRERLAAGAAAAADGFDVSGRVARFVALYESLLDRG